MDAATGESCQKLHEFILIQFGGALVRKAALLEQRQDLVLELLAVLMFARPWCCLWSGLVCIDVHRSIIVTACIVRGIKHASRCEGCHVRTGVRTFQQTLRQGY